MNHENVKAALAPLNAERQSLMASMGAYDLATNNDNRSLAVAAILNNLKTIDELGDKFRAAVFESRTAEELVS